MFKKPDFLGSNKPGLNAGSMPKRNRRPDLTEEQK